MNANFYHYCWQNRLRNECQGHLPRQSSVLSLLFEPKVPIVAPIKRAKSFRKGNITLLDAHLESTPSSEGVYRPGDVLDGSVVVEVSDTLRFKSLSITLMGVARTWIKEKRFLIFPKAEKITQEQTHVDEKQYLLGGIGSGAQQRLPEGQHEFPFRFMMPSDPDMASSFDGHNGYIRYSLVIELCESYAFKHKRVKDIKVLAAPERVENRQRPNTVLQHFPFRIQYYISCQTDKYSYYPGEEIVLRGCVFMGVHDRVTPIFRLSQVQTFQTTEHSYTPEVYTIQIAPVAQGESMSLAKNNFQNIVIQIPTDITPTIHNCQLIKVAYEIEVSLQSSWRSPSWVRKARKIPVRIRPPLLDQQSSPLSHPNPENSQPEIVALPLQTDVQSLPPSYSECMSKRDLPPPSYEEALEQQRKLIHIMND